MGTCVSPAEKQKNPKNELKTTLVIWTENSDQQDNIKTDPQIKMRRSLPNNLIVKVPKKRESKVNEIIHDELTYTIDHQQNPFELKINIRKTSQSLEQGNLPSKWMMDDEISIFDKVNEENEVDFCNGIQVRPVMLDINEILISAIQLSQMVKAMGIEKKQSLTNDSEVQGMEFDKQDQVLTS